MANNAIQQLVSPEPKLTSAPMMGQDRPTAVEASESNLDRIRSQLGMKRTEQGAFEAAQAGFGAEQAGVKARGRAEALGAERQAIEASQPYTESVDVEREMMNARFEPTQRSAQENMALMSAINILGYFIGAGGKGRAQQAMSALNGMLEGKNAGDVERFKQEKIKFDTNVKALKDRYTVLTGQLKRVADLAARDKEKALQELDVVLAENEAGFIKQHVDKFGIAATIKSLEDAEKGAVRLYEKAVASEQQQRRDVESRAFQKQMQNDRLEAQRDLKIALSQGKAEKATQQQFIAQRAVTALRGAASTMETVMQLPADANLGLLPFLPNKEGLLNYVKNYGGRKMSTQEAKAVETLYSGMSRYLATIEASGTATGLVGLANQLEKVVPKAGDTVGDVALKIADTRRIATEAVGAMIDSGLLPGQQAKAAEEQIKRFERAVPFTTNDVIKAQYGGKKSLGEATGAAAAPVLNFATQADAAAADLPVGTRIRIGGKLAVVE